MSVLETHLEFNLEGDDGNVPSGSRSQNGRPLTMTEHLKVVKEDVDQQTIEKQDSLSQSRGRAKTTATTAMSIVNVALLKTVMNQGPDGNKYYLPTLILISVSLALQILAGLFSLLIELRVSYMTKFGKNMCDDMKENCCVCIWRSNDVIDAEKGKQGMGSGDANIENEVDRGTSISKPGDSPKNPNGGACGCCRFVCMTKFLDIGDIQAQQMYRKWKSESLNEEWRSIRAEKDSEYQAQIIENIKKKKAELAKMLKTSESDDNERQMKILKDDQEKALSRKAKCDAILRKSEIHRDQGKLLQSYVESSRKNRIMRLAAFWEHTLTYIYYTIFILNAFITGLGVDWTPDSVSPVPANPSAGPTVTTP